MERRSTYVSGTGTPDRSFDRSENYRESITRTFEEDIAEFRKLMKMDEISDGSSNMGVKNINRDKLNMLVHADIIKTLISDCSKKILICGLLPYFLSQHIDVLSKHVPPEIIEYIKDRFSTSSWSTENLTPHKKFTIETGNLVDQKLVDLVTSLRSKCLMKLALKFKQHASPLNRSLYEALDEFIEVNSSKLQQTAEEFNRKNKTLSEGYLLYKERLFYINRNQQKCKERQLEMNHKLRINSAWIEMTKNKIAEHKASTKRQLNEIVQTSESKMKKKSSEVGEVLLEKQERAENAKTKYQTMLANHLEIEKKLRKNKRRVESTLQNLLNKFDDDVLEKQAEVEQLTESLDQYTIEFNELECLLLEDKKIYEKYSREKRLENDNAIKVKALEFLFERAAKLIQATWKSYQMIRAKKKRR